MQYTTRSRSTADRTSPLASASAAAARDDLGEHGQGFGGQLVARQVPGPLGHADDARRARVDGRAPYRAGISGPATWAAASPRTPSAPPWRPRWRTPSSTAPPRSRRRPRGSTDRPRSTDSLVACTASGAFARDAVRPLERPVHEHLGLDDLVDEAELERPAGRERLGGEQELHGRREGELAGQAGGRAAAGEEPPLRLHHAERGALGVAMRMSTPPSISMPPATHGPSMAAMIGL